MQSFLPYLLSRGHEQILIDYDEFQLQSLDFGKIEKTDLHAHIHIQYACKLTRQILLYNLSYSVVLTALKLHWDTC